MRRNHSGPPRHATARGHRHDMQATYRYLRLAIILLALLLALSVALQIRADDGVILPSVSAYYYTPARDVFVASLCAIGTCLIIYRGRSDLEDVLLNASGYLAFFVAFVPVSPDQVAGEPGAASVHADFSAAVTQNSWAVFAVGLVGFFIELVVVPQQERHRNSRSAKIALAVSAAGYLALLGYFLLARDSFFTYGHGLAAIGLFVGVVGVVGVNATATARSKADIGSGRRKRWTNLYAFGFTLMILTAVVVAIPVRAAVSQWIFILEAALIVQFMAFWVTQTVERWHAPATRSDAFMPG